MFYRPAVAHCVVLLLALVLPQHGLAGTAGARSPSRIGWDFGEFWRSSLSCLAETPPFYFIESRHRLRFWGLNACPREAWWGGASDRVAGVLITVTDAPEAVEPAPLTGWAQIVFPWSQGIQVGRESYADTRSHPLYRAILDCCRLVEIASGLNAMPAGTVGLVGEGYGAGIALAVAALMPTHVQFVVAHQPLTVTAVQMAAGDPAGPSLPKVGHRRAETHLGADSFAPFVSAPTLVTLGTEDPYATPDAVMRLYDALGCPKALWQLEGAGHCTIRDVPGWSQMLQAWANGRFPPA